MILNISFGFRFLCSVVRIVVESVFVVVVVLVVNHELWLFIEKSENIATRVVCCLRGRWLLFSARWIITDGWACLAHSSCLFFITRLLLLLLSPQCGQSSFKASFTSYQVPKPNENRSITICSTCRQLVNTVRSRFLLHMLVLLGRSSPVIKCPIVTFPIGRPGSLPHPG